MTPLALPPRLRHLILPCLLWLGTAVSARASEESPVRFEVERQGRTSLIHANNHAPGAMSVRARLLGNNIRSNRSWPQTVVLGPGERLLLGEVQAREAGAAHDFRISLSAQLGRLNARAASSQRYRLPYADGEAFAISQAASGPITSHQDPLMREAVDFTMPEGTPVHAAREGVVVRVVMHFETGGLDPALLEKANEIVLEHPDGTLGVYAHLAPGSAKVSLGERVQAGQRLASSGNTGYSSGPHLHFALMRPRLIGEHFQLEALPVRFATGQPARTLAPVVGLRASATDKGPARVEYLPVAATQGAR